MSRRRALIPRIRSAEYRSARVLGDVQAVKTGHVGRRVRNRVVGRLLTRLVRGWR